MWPLQRVLGKFWKLCPSCSFYGRNEFFALFCRLVDHVQTFCLPAGSLLSAEWPLCRIDAPQSPSSPQGPQPLGLARAASLLQKRGCLVPSPTPRLGQVLFYTQDKTYNENPQAIPPLYICFPDLETTHDKREAKETFLKEVRENISPLNRWKVCVGGYKINRTRNRGHELSSKWMKKT